jgi:hypothetical protein
MDRLFPAGIAMLALMIAQTARAEYMIYLKGGHYIVADNCTFSASTQIERAEGEHGKDDGSVKRAIVSEDCTKGKPEGRIFWSTIDGRFGEINADDVYGIFGARTSMPERQPLLKPPLEDYLITTRGESFVNVERYREKGTSVTGHKRDELAKIDRRGIFEIAPEGAAGTRSAEGLCPGELPEFAVTETEAIDGRLIGVITNLSQAPWRPWIDVEVRVKGKRLGKFQVEDSNILSPGTSVVFDEKIPPRFVKEIERAKDPEASVRVCYRRVKAGVGQLTK